MVAIENIGIYLYFSFDNKTFSVRDISLTIRTIARRWYIVDDEIGFIRFFLEIYSTSQMSKM